jgi:uncharacterized protein YjbI with pentapeptide repeats
MKTMTQEEINEKIKAHALWLAEKPGGERADFSGLNISGKNLEGANLRHAIFRGTIATGTIFTGAQLDWANFRHAYIDSANLCGANVSYANFALAELTHADFSGADANHADFSGANATFADFTGAKLNDAEFVRAKIICASFTGAKLIATGFVRSEISGANFTGANMHLAELEDAKSPGVIGIYIARQCGENDYRPFVFLLDGSPVYCAEGFSGSVSELRSAVIAKYTHPDNADIRWMLDEYMREIDKMYEFAKEMGWEE